MVVIVVSGMPVCGSSTAAKKLAKKLKLKYFSLGKEFKKHMKGKETDRAIKMFKTEKGASRSFHEHLDDKQRELAEKGDIVIDSKLGIYMLKDIADYKIWLKANKTEIAKRVASREKISLKEARKLMEERTKIERQRFKKIYGFDTFSQEKLADLVVDTSRRTPEQTINAILKFIRTKEKKKSAVR